MTNLLIKKFIKNSDSIQDSDVKLHYGVLGSITGIICNLILFVLKFLIGYIMHAVVITADAFNNLSDCITCIVALVGYHVSNRPADQNHPFGHGRMEYIFSLAASVLICLVGFELLKDSIDQILHPSQIIFHTGLFIALLASVFVKMWMARFYRVLGEKTGNNTILMASSQDSKNDVLTTLTTLLSLLVSLYFPQYPVNGVMGLIVSVMILFSGYSLARDIIDHLIGKPVDVELVTEIEQIIKSNQNVIGVHDLIIHDYGAGKKIGSGHVELNSTLSFVEAHHIVDVCERLIENKTHVDMTLHMDPVDLEDEERRKYYEIVVSALSQLDRRISVHDFRLIHHKQDLLVFDLLIPFDNKLSHEEIENKLQDALNNQVKLRITYDHTFTN